MGNISLTKGGKSYEISRYDFLFAVLFTVPVANAQGREEDDLKEWNNQIRREKFDLVLPQVMKKNNIDMWIHVMRIAIPDPFGAGALGSTSGVFIFTDRGGDRIERAVLGRRWGASQREREELETNLIEEYGVYDIIHDPVRVQEPVGSPMTEYDFRFKGIREFVEERDHNHIAVNYIHDLGPWETYRGARDGISLTDYLLLIEELGDKYANRLFSSEYVIMDYITRKVPSEIQLLKRISKEEVERVKKAFAAIVPGVTKNQESGVTVFRRMSTGLSQRGRSADWENSVIQGGDILASPERGMHAYVLQPSGRVLPHYTRKFEDEGDIIRDNQLHMAIPKNNFYVYSIGFDPERTRPNMDAHGMMKGARDGKEFENYLGPRIDSLCPDWSKDIPLPPNHHFVLEYFFYMPSPTFNDDEDQYLLFWNHEEAIATESGVEYLSPP